MPSISGDDLIEPEQSRKGQQKQAYLVDEMNGNCSFQSYWQGGLAMYNIDKSVKTHQTWISQIESRNFDITSCKVWAYAENR